MLRLIEKTPVWKDVLPGVRIEFAPVTNKSWRAARRAAAAVLGLASEEDLGEDLREDAGDAFSRALLEGAITAWDGVGDVDGMPLAVTPDAIRMLLADPRRFEACDAAYVLPLVLEDAEGNASAGSPNGISPAATPAPDTASSPAKPRRARGAKTARTERTNRRPKPA